MIPRVARLEDIPNIGAEMAKDLRLLGVKVPSDLKGRDAWRLYEDLCRKTRAFHDPCVLDTLMAVVAFVETGDRRPWWIHTGRRKRMYGARLDALRASFGPA